MLSSTILLCTLKVDIFSMSIKILLSWIRYFSSIGMEYSDRVPGFNARS